MESKSVAADGIEALGGRSSVGRAVPVYPVI